MRLTLVPAALAALLVACGSLPESAPDLEPAKALYQRYTALASALDRSRVDLLAPEAKGFLHVLTGTGEIHILPVSRGELVRTMTNNSVDVNLKPATDRFGQPAFSRAGRKVRVRTLQRVPGMTKPRPFSMLVGPSAGGQWLIYELRETVTPQELENIGRRAERARARASENADQN